MKAILRALRSPGATRTVTATAPSLPSGPISRDTCTGDARYSDESENLHTLCYNPPKKPGILDRALDSVVKASGSTAVFLVIQLLLFTWAFLGIPYDREQLWPIIISDAQAIFSYVFDSLLMRQQMNGHLESLIIAAQLRSRSATNRRMLSAVASQLGDNLDGIAERARHASVLDIKLPKESWFTRAVSCAAAVLGHILFLSLYWTCIVVWIAFGPSNHWSNEWQLYINSATSALMVFVFSFLAILRERHADYMRSCVDTIYRVDGLLEYKLRTLTKDPIASEPFDILPARVNRIQRAINYYADIVGTLVGIAILVVVLIVWIAIGPALDFDSNWWLLIGTYAGLIGLNDGFVLRNVQAKLRDHENPQYAALTVEDAAQLESLQLRSPRTAYGPKMTISLRISEGMNKICAHEVTVILGVLLIVGLLVGSSAMHWSETGQLFCNIPPSIVESFFMIILITGHNSADAQKRVDLRNVFERRLQILAFVDVASNVCGYDMIKPGVMETRQVKTMPSEMRLEEA